MNLALSVVTIVLVADFLSGVGHWLEDTYFRPSTPLIGKIIQRNIEHHLNPRVFIENPWFITIRITSRFVIALAVLLHFAGYLDWVSGLALLMLLFANQVHKWAHMHVENVPWVIRLLQRWRLMQTATHHRTHHIGDKNTVNCVLTNFLNPMLDSINFWRGVEHLVYLLTGCQPRPDPTVKTMMHSVIVITRYSQPKRGKGIRNIREGKLALEDKLWF